MAPTKTQRNRPQQRQTPRRNTQRPNRAQIQAMEARSVATATTPITVEHPRASAVVSAPARGRAAARKQVNRVFTLSREAEYAYVRSDMRRLLIIAAGLFTLMLVLLFILG